MNPNCIKEKKKLLQSCTGSHSNVAVPIFKNLKDSKNIKSEGRREGKKKKKNLCFYQKGKKMHMFLIGASDEITYGQPSVCRCASQKISIAPSSQFLKERGYFSPSLHCSDKAGFQIPRGALKPTAPQLHFVIRAGSAMA